MRLVSFYDTDGVRAGIVTSRGIVAAGRLEHSPGASIEDVVRADADQLLLAAEEAETAEARPEAETHLGACVPRPGKIICIGRNYREHANEVGNPVPDTPLLFSKFSSAVAAPGESIPLIPDAEQYDYEAELAVVIGRAASRVSEGEALAHVFGYCNSNDLSARDLQFRSSQWLLGKSLDHFLPLGPYLVTADEVGDPQSLRVRCWVNGEIRQDAPTSDMVFSVAELVSYISTYITLQPGDVIATGTPEGVILGMKDKHWLRAGDEITVEITGLGRLTNTLVAMSP